MDCPRCESELEIRFCTGGRTLRCAECSGTAITIGMLRRFAPKERVDALWRRAMREHPGGLLCAGCDGHLRDVDVRIDAETMRLEVCTHCHLVWFDADTLLAFSPERDEPEADEAGRAVDAGRMGGVATSSTSRDEVWRVVTSLQGLLR
jgi:Zn-finger nucleic acid-binding protein